MEANMRQIGEFGSNENRKLKAKNSGVNNKNNTGVVQKAESQKAARWVLDH